MNKNLVQHIKSIDFTLEYLLDKVRNLEVNGGGGSFDTITGSPLDNEELAAELATKEDVINKVSAILGNEASVTKYPNVKGVVDWVTLNVQTAPFLGTIVPTSTPTGIGAAYWIAVQAGTYTNFGGVIVATNSFAVVSRSSTGTFSISQTPLNLTDYYKKKESGITATIATSPGFICNYNTATRTLDLKSIVNVESVLLYENTYYVIPANTTVVNNISSTSLTKLIFNTSTLAFSFIHWADVLTTNQILIATVRQSTAVGSKDAIFSSNFKISVDADIVPVVMDKPLKVLTGSGDIAYLPVVNSVAKTLIFPANIYDYVFYVGGEMYTQAIPTSQVVIDLSPMTGSTAWTILWEVATKTFSLCVYSQVTSFKNTHVLFATCRIVSGKYYFNMPIPFVADGVYYGGGGSGVTVNTLDATVKAINHRGYSSVAPENTLPAYKLSKDKGFRYVETDVEWTLDNVPVLLHDSTIDRTSNSTGNVADKTLAELKLLDFGSWKSPTYAGTKIPTLEEFIFQCKKLNLYPYIELKGAIDAPRCALLVDIVKKAGMIKFVTWISFASSSLSNILIADPKARIGYLGSLSSGLITTALSLKTANNSVFLDCDAASITDALVESALLSDIQVEAWTVNNSASVDPLVSMGVSGITTDNLNIAEILNV